MATKRFRSSYKRLLALWVLRALAPGLARAGFIRNSEYADDEIAEFLGFPRRPDAAQLLTIPRLLDDLRESLENSPVCLPTLARENFAKFAKILRLDPIERQVLEFYACLAVESQLSGMWRLLLKHCADSGTSQVVYKILKLPQSSVSKAQARNGRLARCGLLNRFSHPLKRGNLEFHSDTLAEHLFQDKFDPNKLLKSFGINVPPPPELTLADYPHLRKSMDLLLPYLKKIRSTHKRGVNILFHGDPGTGKTQLVRVLGHALDVPVFEFDTGDNDGEPLNAERRLCSLNLAQTFFQSDPALLVFDEAEDILKPSPRDRGMVNSHKGWFNQMLGSNRHPVFWISNSIDTLDPAFSRRFDFILEVPIPPKAQRGRILREQAGKLVTPRLIEHLAEIEHLAPAVVTRARDVILAIGREIPKGDRDAAFTHIIGGILKAQGHPDPSLPSRHILPTDVYDIAHLNTTSDLRQMAGMLKSRPSARLCLHGPPGTGKTAFGHWLANEIERPIQVERGSDLFSPFVGMTEKTIARTFERAARNEAVLLIDEVDSFLQDRTRAKHSWEVTQINEMLTQIETFPGIFIASTNFLDHLDAASLRRFDIKLHFDYLLPAQTRLLLASYCRNLDLRAPEAEDLAMASALESATPGDFAAVARRHRFQPFKDARCLLLAVTEECEIKTDRTRRIGFQ